LDKVGDFVLGIVVKARLEQDGYLACIGGTDRLAVLPRVNADHEYRVHDSFYAAIGRMPVPEKSQHYPLLSQRSGHFLRHVCRLVFQPLLDDGSLKVHAVATVQKSGFFKIAVSGPDGEDPIKRALPFVNEFRRYTKLKPSLIRYSHEIEIFIRRALSPAPVDCIVQVTLSRREKKSTVVVPVQRVGRFLGTSGLNVAVASRLTGFAIRIVGEEEPAASNLGRRMEHAERYAST